MHFISCHQCSRLNSITLWQWIIHNKISENLSLQLTFEPIPQRYHEEKLYPFRHNRRARLSGLRSKISLSNEISNIYVQVPFTIKRNSEFTDLVSCGGDNDFIFDPILRRSVFPLQTPTACGSIPRRSKLAGVRSHPKKSHALRIERATRETLPSAITRYKAFASSCESHGDSIVKTLIKTWNKFQKLWFFYHYMQVKQFKLTPVKEIAICIQEAV